MDYAKLYEALYQEGYRKGADRCVGRGFIRDVVEFLEFETVLDVGCSYGKSLAILTKLGKRATGTEVSPTAIAKAKALGRDCVYGSILDLPFSAESFDLVLSTDVIEHIAEADMKMAFTEMIRVSKKYLALQIAFGKSKHVWPHLTRDNLHLTIWDEYEWQIFLAQFPELQLLKFSKSNQGKNLMFLLEKSDGS